MQSDIEVKPGLNRYALPVPEGWDGESIVLCSSCLGELTPEDVANLCSEKVSKEATEQPLEWLESKPAWRGCDGEACQEADDEDDGLTEEEAA